MRNWFLSVIGYSLLLMFTVISTAQDLPPCGDARPTTITLPWSGAGDLWCLEQVVMNSNVGAVGYTALATAPNALYTLLPETGEVIRLDDTNGDALPDTPVTVVSGLLRPTGITYYEKALYIAGQTRIYRYDLITAELTTLVEEFPGGWTGYPSGGLAVYEGWLYVGAGGDVMCTTGRGAVWRYRLDGSLGELYADGLRAPADIAVYNNTLYVVDTASDTLWQLVEGVDYGACSGNSPPPEIYHHTFEAGAAPIALSPNPHPIFPIAAQRLLVGLQGRVGGVTVNGYKVVAVDLQGNTPPEDILPRNAPHLNVSDQQMHIQGSGFYPHHVYGVAVDQHGWIYVSASGGRIVALRPLN